MSLLDRVSGHLDRAGVQHALIGAAALAAAGVSRSTFDIDLLVIDRRCLDRDFWSPLAGELADLEIRRGDADDPLAGVVRLAAAGERPVDIVVGRHAWQRRAIERASGREGAPPVVRPVDLVLLKLYAGGTQDLWDVRQLLEAAGGGDLASAVTAELPGMPAALSRTWALVMTAPGA